MNIYYTGTVTTRPFASADDYMDDGNQGICAFQIRPFDFEVAIEFSECLEYMYTAFRPSLGMNIYVIHMILSNYFTYWYMKNNHFI